MFAVIKYEDGEIKDFHDYHDVEEYKALMRNEVKTFAKGRQYEIVIREDGKTVFYFESKTKTIK